jgi:hypothetical protein
MTDFESGINVYFGEYVPLETANLITYETPETILLSRSFLEGVSSDAKTALELIMTAFDKPDACLRNGKMRRMMIRKMLREEAHWSFRRIFSVLTELKELSQSF